jgi:hypothetical protein
VHGWDSVSEPELHEPMFVASLDLFWSCIAMKTLQYTLQIVKKLDPGMTQKVVINDEAVTGSKTCFSHFRYF